MKRALALLLFFALPAQAEVAVQREALTLAGPMVADISQSSIQIHSSFNGTELLVFGARNARGDLVVAVRGPAANMRLRQKERIAGMWMHVDQTRYNDLPMFYAIASTRPLKRIAPAYTLNQLGLGEHAVVTTAAPQATSAFNKALRETMERKLRWQEPFGRITYFGESLFKARLHLPSTMPRGHYSVEVYLFDEGKPIAFQTIPLKAFKTGMDATIYDEAQRHPWLYGIAAILMALAGGWLAHRLFKKD